MRKIPRNVFCLGVVSFLTDLSSEMILPVILPLFMRAQGIALPAIGLIEGVAESSSSLLKLGSGWLSDRVRHRKALVGVGYGLSTVVKPVFAFAGVWWHFLTIRFVERMGKGVRTAPRDALLAASVTQDTRGGAFGFHRAMDTAGAFFGLLSALVLVWVLKLEPEGFRPLFWIAFVPAALAVLVIVFFVREVPPPPAPDGEERRVRGPLSARFKAYLLVTGLFTLGNSSDAFLALRAEGLGLSTLRILLLMLAMNAVYAGLATHLGRLSDRIGRTRMLATSFLVYAAVYAGLAFAGAGWMLWPLFVVYGLYYAMAEGSFRAIVADLVPEHLRGYGYGLFHMVVGVVAVPSSVIMGWLWKAVGVEYAFSFGAVMALAAMILMLALVARPHASGLDQA